MTINCKDKVAIVTGAGGGLLLTAVLGLTCAGALWHAFFPPEAYRRRFAPALRGA